MASWAERQKKQYEEFEKQLKQAGPVRKKPTKAVEQFLNPRNEGYEEWKVDRAARVKKSDLDAQLGIPSRDRMVLDFGKDFKEPKTTQSWQKAYLKDLPIKKYGRSYNDKFTNWALEQGVPQNMHTQFKQWLNADEQGLKSDAWHATEGQREKNVAVSKAKEESEKRQESRKRELSEAVNLQPAKKKESNKLLDFLKHGSNASRQDPSKTGTLGLLNAAKEKAYQKVDGYERFDNRLANSQSLGLIQNKALRDLKDNPTPEKQEAYERLFGEAKGGGQKTSDVLAELLGYAGPGIGASIGIRGAAKMAGKELGKGSLKRTAAETAAEGALIGAGIGGGEVAVRESLNPEDYNAMQNLAHIGINTAAGAILDPALSLAMPAFRQLSRRAAAEAMEAASKGQTDRLAQIFKQEGVDPSAVDPLFNTGGRVPESEAARILSGQGAPDVARNVQNPLGQLGELNPRVSQAQALRELTQAPTRAKLRSPEVPRATFDPDAPFESKMEYFRNADNPITPNEVPHAMQMLQELESQAAKLSDRFTPEYGQVETKLYTENPEYRARMEEITERQRKMEDAVNRMDQWDEVKKMQELYKPANRPEYYKFKIPDDFKEDFRDVPKRFRSAKDSAMHIDEAATAAGYDSVDDFVQHLVSMDQALGVKRKDLDIPAYGYLTGQSKHVEKLKSETDEMYRKFAGLDEMEAQMDELVQYMRPREGVPSDPFENMRTSTAPRRLESEPMDPLGEMSDDMINNLINRRTQNPEPEISERELLEQTVGEPAAAMEMKPMPKGSPTGVVAGRVEPYVGSPIANPRSAERLREKVGSLSEGVRNFRETFDSSIQPAKDLEKIVTRELMNLDNNVQNVLAMLPDKNHRAIAFEDNFAKQLQSLPKAVAKGVRSYKQGYDPIFKVLKKNNIPREQFENYALARHAQDIYAKNAEKAERLGELELELERIEAERQTNKDRSALDKQEHEIQKEMKDLEMYMLPDVATEDWANGIVKQFENVNGMEEARKMFVNEQKKDLYARYKTGQYTKEQIESMMKAHPNYVSLMRDVPDAKFNISSLKKANKLTRRGKGSKELKILPPLDSAFNNRMARFDAVAKNDMIMTLKNWSKIDGMESLVREVPESTRHSITGYENGKEVHFELAPFLQNLMEYSGGGKDNFLFKVLRGGATAFKRGTTNWNPQFHIKSALRDTTQALANSRTDAKMWDMAAGFLDSFIGPQLSKVTGGRFKSYKEVYKDMGGEMAGFISQDTYSINRITEAMRKGVLDGNPVLDVMKMPFRGIEKFGMTMEHGARLGEFRSAKKKGYSDADASFEATDIIDYSDQGTFTKKANPYDPYLTATIRGNVRTFQAMKNNPKQFVSTGLTFVTMPTLAMYAARYSPTTSDEQRAKIENMPTWQKNAFWAVPIPNTETIALMPKPFILGQLFANPIERMLEKTFVDTEKPNSEITKETIKDLMNVGMPPISVIGASTAIELLADKDLFTGIPIEGDQFKYVKDPTERYDAYTSEVAKNVGSATNTSPKKVDHVLKKLGGTMGRQGLDIYDNILAQEGERPAKVEPTSKILNPLGSLVYKDTSASGLYMRIQNQAADDNAKWLAENPTKKNTRKKDRPKTSAQRAAEHMKELNDEIKEIRESTKYSSQEKSEMIGELRTQQKLIGSEYLRK